MSLARVLARLRSWRGRAYVFGVLFALVALVPLAHTSPTDPLWIAGIYDAGDFDEVVWALTSADSVCPPTRLVETPRLLVAKVPTEVSVSSVVAAAISAVRPRSPPRI